MTFNAALAGADLTAYQAGGFKGDWYLSVAPQTTYATALINQAVFTTPIGTITVDNTSADWLTVQPNMIAWIGTTAGARDIGVYRVKSTGATSLVIGEITSGDHGLVTKRVTAPLADNAHITIKEAPNVWSVFPKITFSGSTGTFLKDSTITYTNQNSTGGAMPGIINIGEHKAARIADAAVFEDVRAISSSLFASSISAILWTIHADGVVTAGGTTQSSITVEYPPGDYVVRCRVTLANGAVIYVQRYTFVHGDTVNPPKEVVISGGSETDRYSVSLNLVDDFDTDILAGALVMVWCDVDSTAIASSTTKFVGFVESVDGIFASGAGADLQVISPLEILSRVTGFSQELTYAASPADWQQSNLMTVDFFIFYLLYWHTTLLSLFDITLTGLSSYTRYQWRTGAGNWVEAVNGALDSILPDTKLTQHPHGSLQVVRDPSMLATGDRSGVPTRITIDETLTVKGSVQTSRRVRPPTGKVEGYAFPVGTSQPATAYASMAIGNVGGQGGDLPRITDQLVTGANDAARQAELNIRTANRYAKANNPYVRITLSLASGYLVINPSMRYFVQLSITDTNYLPEGSTETLNCKAVPIEASWSLENGVPLQRLTLEAETNGTATPGETMPITARTGAEINVPTFNLDTGLPELEFEPFSFPDYFGLPPIGAIAVEEYTGTPGSISDLAVVITWAADGVVLTENFNEAAPDWEVIFTPGVGEEVVDAALDVDSGLYILCTDGIYYTADPVNVAATLQSALVGGKLIRAVDGVTGGVAVIGYEDDQLYDFDFTIDDQDWYTVASAGVGVPTPDGVSGVYNPGVGWQKSGIDPGGGGVDVCRIAFDVGASAYLTRIVGTFTATGPEDASDAAFIGSRPVGDLAAANNAIANTGGTLDTGAVAAEAERYLLMVVANDYAAGTMVITEFQAYGYKTRIWYSSNYGATFTEVEVAAYAGEHAFDVDDFNAGVIVLAARNHIYYMNSYTGAASLLTGLTGVADGTEITCVRVPYRKLATQALNNSASSMQFIYGTGAAVSGKTLWGITFNASSGAIIAQSNMTPTIGSTTYYVIGPNALVTNGDDTQDIIALCKPVGGGTTHLLKSTTGGDPDSWQDLGAVDGIYTDIVPAANGGENGEYVLAGGVGIRHAASFNSSLQSRDGDFGSELAESALGVLAYE